MSCGVQIGKSNKALPILPAGGSSRAASEDLPLPTVQALDELWRRAQTQSFYAPSRLFRYLALRRTMRVKLLDPSRQRLSLPTGKVNDCSACTEICCVGPRAQVLLRLRDVATLHDIGRTQLMTHQGICYSAEELRERPALRRQISARDWSVLPKLKQNSFGACSALSRDGLCSLYPHWPMTCARFPYSLHLTDEEIFFSARCQSYFVHPSRHDQVVQGRIDAVATYNERIKDAILLTFFREELGALDLLQYLKR